MLLEPTTQQYKLVLEEIYLGPWTQGVRWGYYTGERQADALIHSRSVNPDHAALFWAEEAIALLLSARMVGVKAHLEPRLTVTF